MLFNELISSKIQLKWVYRKYGYAQYRGIVHGSMRKSNACSSKILLVRSSRSSAVSNQSKRILIYIYIYIRATKHIRCLKRRTRYREPQRAGLNMRRKVISRLPSGPVFICHVGACGFISRQSALIAWHNAFKAVLSYPWEGKKHFHIFFPTVIWFRHTQLFSFLDLLERKSAQNCDIKN